MADVVPAWIWDVPAEDACPAHLDDRPDECWRLYTSNAELPGKRPGLGQVRCGKWVPKPEEFEPEATA